jgi:hypothetical protein
MAKIIYILLIIASFFPSSVLGDELDGFAWEKMDQTDRTLLLTGYVNGFRLGTVHGADFGVETSAKYLKELSNSSVYGVRLFKDYWKCGTTIDKNRATILDAAARYGKNSFSQPVAYYIKEVNSFYKEHPTCKERDLLEMLRDISLVWLEIRSYEEIAKECSAGRPL